MYELKTGWRLGSTARRKSYPGQIQASAIGVYCIQPDQTKMKSIYLRRLKRASIGSLLLGLLWFNVIMTLEGIGQTSPPPPKHVRARDLGIPFDGTPGPYNAITDVPEIEVGYKTLISGEGPTVIRKGPIRTGVTAILPRGKKDGSSVFAGFFVGNGNGDMTGTHWIDESGVLETPILLTNTLSVGIVRDAAAAWMIQRNRPRLFWYPVVAETADAYLNDMKGQHVTRQDAFDALNSAVGGPVAEGNVGGGTGMICNLFKGGSGTSSRVVKIDGHPYTVGVFVQCNYGRRGDLRIAGIPVGREMKAPPPCLAKQLDPVPEELKNANLPLCAKVSGVSNSDGYDPRTGAQGSIIVIVATDAPLTPDQLKRLARRVTLGLGRAGSNLDNSSGDLFLAFSTANEGADEGNSTGPQAAATSNVQRLISSVLDPLFQATAQATEEAVDNAMIAATTMTGANYLVISALPHAELQRVLRDHNIGPIAPR